MTRSEAPLPNGQRWTAVVRPAPHGRAVSPRWQRLQRWRGAMRARFGAGRRATAVRWPALWRVRRERLARSMAESWGLLPRARRALAVALASTGAFLLLAGTFLARCVGPLGVSTFAHLLTVLCGLLVLAGGGLARVERLLRPTPLAAAWWRGRSAAWASWDTVLRRADRTG